MSTPSDELPHIDQAKLDDLRALESAGKEGFFARIVLAFLNDARSRVKAMDDGIEGADGDGVAHGAHALKGSCSYLGAIRLARLCAGVEELAMRGDLSSAGRTMPEVQQELVEVDKILRRAIDTDRALQKE